MACRVARDCYSFSNIDTELTSETQERAEKKKAFVLNMHGWATRASMSPFSLVHGEDLSGCHWSWMFCRLSSIMLFFGYDARPSHSSRRLSSDLFFSFFFIAFLLSSFIQYFWCGQISRLSCRDMHTWYAFDCPFELCCSW